MDLPPAHLVAASVLTAYGILPSRGKPSVRPNGVREWTVLAGFSLASLSSAADWDVQCVALGTGMKALPFEKLPKQGDVLHDSHAEVIARRGLLLYLYQQMLREDGCLVREDGGWRLRKGMVLCMYVSTLPCGDASMYSLSLVAPPSPPISPISLVDPVPLLASTLLATSLGLGTSRTSPSTPSITLRGRTAYAALGSLRTKPGRLDSKPTISHSCSDKLALWNVAGIQGGLLSSLGVDLRVGLMVIGGVEEELWERVGVEVRRALGERVGRTVNVIFTNKMFRDGEREIEGVVSCSESLSWVKGERSEVIVNGICAGATLKRKGLDALTSKSRSRLCKLSLFETFLRTANSLHISVPPQTTYYEAKRLPLSSPFQLSRSTLRSPSAPFAGWITSGIAFESFLSSGLVNLPASQ